MIRVTGDQGTRAQRLRVAMERSVFSQTHPVLHENAGDIDVGPLVQWLDSAADVQMVDVVGAKMADTVEWQHSPRLHRVKAQGVDEGIIYDKWAYTRLARRCGIPVPESRAILDEYPAGSWMLKGRLGSGGDRVATTEDTTDVLATLSRWGIAADQAFLQQRIYGQLWNVAGVARFGEVLVASTYRAFSAAGDPQGPPVSLQILDRPDLIAISETLVHELGYHGPFAIDLIDDGTAYLLDFNPRFFGTWATLQASGVDLLGAYLSTLGHPWRRGSPQVSSRRLSASVSEGASISQTWKNARDFTGTVDKVIGRRATMAVTVNAMSKAWRKPAPTVAIAYSEPWLAGIQFAAALRRRGVKVRRFTVAPESLPQRARCAGESLAFDSSGYRLRDEGAVIHIDDPQALLVDVVDVQTTERVLRTMLDTAAWAAAKHLHPVPNGVEHSLLCDKAALHAWARAHGIPVARHFPDGTVPDRWPVILKPAVGYGGVGAKICRNVEEFEQAQTQAQTVIEEVLPGPQVNVAGVARAGETLLSLAYRPTPAHGHWQGPPVAIEILESCQAVEVAETVLAHLRYSGPFCIDLMQDAHGHFKVVDVNARIFGSWSGLQRAGADILGAYLHSLDLGPVPKTTRIAPGLRLAVDVDPAASPGQSLRALSRGMRPLTGYTGMLAQAAPVLATFARHRS